MPNTKYLKDVVESTLHNSDHLLADNIFQKQVILYIITSKAKKRKVSGGLTLEKDVSIGRNPTFGFRNPYVATPAQRYNFLGRIKYPWSHMSGTVVVYDEDLEVNREPHQIRSYTQALMENTEQSFREVIGSAIYSDGTPFDPLDGEFFLGLEAMISATNIYGSLMNIDQTFTAINRALPANDWWRANVQAVNAPLKVEGTSPSVRWMLNRCAQGDTKGPDTLLTTLDIWLNWVAMYGAQQPLTNPDMAKLGFDNIYFGGADVYHDKGITNGVPAGTMYFLDTDWMELETRNTDSLKFKQTEWKDLPAGTPGQYKRLTLAAQLTTKQPRRLGKLTGITAN
jgi:hypothetical protein